MGFSCKVAAQECLGGHNWDVLGCGTEGTKDCSALEVSGFHVGSLYGAICPCKEGLLGGTIVGPLTCEFSTESL